MNQKLEMHCTEQARQKTRQLKSEIFGKNRLLILKNSLPKKETLPNLVKKTRRIVGIFYCIATTFLDLPQKVFITLTLRQSRDLIFTFTATAAFCA
jgi:hypothetical protein